MSKRTSSGSRFDPLPIEGESDSEEDSDSSSEEEMKLSKDFYPTTLPGFRAAPANPEDLTKYLPASPGAGPSGLQSQHSTSSRSSQNRVITSRSMGSKPTPPKHSSGLDFTWGYYSKDPNVVDDTDPTLPSLVPTDQTTQQDDDLPQSIDEDLPILRSIGFNIMYPNERFGSGFYGTVYVGYYGSAPPGPESADARFAVKIMDFGSKPDEQTREMREMFETEKFILTKAKHKNIVTIRMIINMGGVRPFVFRNDPQRRTTFLSPQRIYVIMDFAAGGDLEKYLDKNGKKLDPWTRISWMRDLFAGMAYLHNEGILHGDVHAGNVLLFPEPDGTMVAKWADFGLGAVGSDKQYRFLQRKTDLSERIVKEIYDLGSLFAHIMRERYFFKRKETPQEKKIMDEFEAMTKQMRKDKFKTLEEVHHKYKHILEDEIELNPKQ